MAENMGMMNQPGLEETLHRVFSLINDEMIRLSWNLKDDLQGIKDSTGVVIAVLQSAEEQQLASEAVRHWLNKLEEVAYEAEDVLNELSYEILCRKVRKNSSLGRIRFLKNVVFNSQLAQRIRNLNKAIRVICNEGNDHLRPEGTRLRTCLAFCLSFRKEFRVQKTELIQLWMAAGLLESYDEGNDDHFIQSVLRRVLIDVEKDEEGNTVVYKIHANEQRRWFSRENIFACSALYLYATTSVDIQQFRTNKLRSLILDGVPFEESRNLERLRMLVFLNSVDMEMLPSSIRRLKFLRYLDVSNTRIRVLPEFITKLYNLQTLRFLHCKELIKLPTQFANLINLKNIAFSFEHQMPFGLGCLTCLEMLSFFVVGSDRGGSIKELRYLHGLRGHLEITKLEEVRDRKEAESANMPLKEKIDGLSFQWSCGAHDRSSRDEEVLEGLKPRPDIPKIKIKYYMGANWPMWMLRTSSLMNLVSLTLERCWNCILLPCLGVLPSLRFLTMQHMKKVKCVYNEMYKENDSEGNHNPRCLFPELKSLSLSWMENLTEWSSTDKPLDDKMVVVFPRLQTLSIQSCTKLISFPMKDLSELAKMEIKDCDELRFIFHEQQSFPSLTNLSIEGCPKLTNLPDRLLSSKRFNRLAIRRCEWLKFTPDNLGLQLSLSSLVLNCCKGLTFFSEETLCKLFQLKKLSIGAFSEKLDDFRYLNGIKGPAQLKELEIWGSDFLGRKMSHLPNQLQQLTRLRSLKIMGFTTMEEMPEWFSNLKSLQCLSLNYCWHLKYQSLATIVRQMSSLKHLYIYGCHALEENKSQWNEFSLATDIRIHFSQLAEVA